MGIHYLSFDRKMASVSPDQLSKEQKDELCCSYAALMLHDDGLEINAEKIGQIIKASGNTVEPYWPMLFSKALKGANVGDLLTQVASAGPAGGGGGAGPAAAAEEAPKEEEKKVEEETVDMGGLFGDDDDEY